MRCARLNNLIKKQPQNLRATIGPKARTRNCSHIHCATWATRQQHKYSTTTMAVSNHTSDIAIDEALCIKKQPISTIVIVIAMQAEALPLIKRFDLKQDLDSVFPKGFPWIRYHGVYKKLHLNIVLPGKDIVLGVDSVGTVTASLLTCASIQALQPDLIINAGTAGGFKAKGANIGDVFLATHVAFHDRRNPLPVRDQYSIGLRQALSTPNLTNELALKVGKLSTGDSLDMCAQDEALIKANDATVKDMEGAAVAYVTDHMKVPTIFLKAVTDIVDGDKPTEEEFLQNLALVTHNLGNTVAQVVNFIDGKCLSEL